MNTERVKRLIEELEQHPSGIRTHLRYLKMGLELMCPLGHACKLYREDTGRGGWRPAIKPHTYIFFVGKPDYEEGGMLIPLEVMEHFGMRHDQVVELAFANDERGRPAALSYLKQLYKAEMQCTTTAKS